MQDLGINVLLQGSNALRLLGGLWVTIRIGLFSIILSVPLGIAFGVFMTWRNPIARACSRIYLDFIRIMPQLVLLFLVFFGVTRTFGINLSMWTSAIIVFTLWGTAEMGDLVRGALVSMPKHQYDSASALGMNAMQTFGYIIIPQVTHRLLPLAINLTTRMIKTTSLVTLIGMVEVLKVGRQIIDANRFEYPSAALWIYAVIFFLYFIVCWSVSQFAKFLENKWEGA